MKPKLMPVLMQCIETGIARGWTRAHKHDPTPESSAVKLAIENAVWEELYDWCDFDEESDDKARQTS